MKSFFYRALFYDQRAFSIREHRLYLKTESKVQKLAHEIKPKARRTTPSYQRVICDS